MALAHTVEEVKLKNGMQGLLIDVPGTTSVYYTFCFRAGTDYVADSQKSQAAHIMEHLAFGKNAKFASSEAFSQEFTKNGAYQNAWTSSTNMLYEAVAPLMEWDRIMGLQTLAITEPRYTQKNIDIEKSTVREELEGYATRHGRILWQEVMKASGLQRWYDPKELATIDAITLKDIKAHFAATHTTKNMRFVLAGHLQPHRQALLDQLEAWPLQAGKRLPLRKEAAHAGGAVFIPRKDLPTLTFNLTFFNNRELGRDELRTMGVLCYLLTDTMHSRIFGKARTRGICYGMGSGFDATPTGVSTFDIGGQVSFANARELFALIIAELKDIQHSGIAEEELQQAKDYRLGSLQLANETVRALAGWYTGLYYDDGIIDHLDTMPGRIAKTKTQDVQVLLNEFLTSGAWTFGGIGNSSAAEFQKFYAQFETALTPSVQ